MMSEIYGALLQFVIILMFSYSFLMSMRKYDLHLEYVHLKCKQAYFEEMCLKKKVIQHLMNLNSIRLPNVQLWITEGLLCYAHAQHAQHTLSCYLCMDLH